MTASQVDDRGQDVNVGNLQGISSEVAKKDASYILKAQKRLLRLKNRLGNWLKVEAEIHVNHGHMSALILHGTVPHSKELRLALGLPSILPSERTPRRPRRVLPGSPCAGCKALREFRARCKLPPMQK
jgi:hypothetical protein